MAFRIGVGKKIGGVYLGFSKTIGGNKGGKGNGGCWLKGLAILFFPITLIYLFCKWAYKKTKQQKAENPDNVWYKRTWGIVLLLIFFFPIGIYLMWKYANWHKYIKIGVCVLIGAVAVASLFSPNNGSEQDESSSIVDSTEPVTEETTELPTEAPTEEITEAPTEAPTEEQTEAVVEETAKLTREYAINYDTGKFHKPTCHTIEDSTNIGTCESTKNDLEAQGYVACKVCDPR